MGEVNFLPLGLATRELQIQDGGSRQYGTRWYTMQREATLHRLASDATNGKEEAWTNKTSVASAAGRS